MDDPPVVHVKKDVVEGAVGNAQDKLDNKADGVGDDEIGLDVMKTASVVAKCRWKEVRRRMTCGDGVLVVRPQEPAVPCVWPAEGSWGRWSRRTVRGSIAWNTA